MSEQLKTPQGPEVQSHDTSEQLKALEKSIERNAEKAGESSHERADSARRDTKEIFSKEAGKERSASHIDGDSVRASRKVSGAQKKESYAHTMKSVRAHMTPSERAFSKVIHNKTIEKTSQVVGNTVARPNAILAGSLSALILVTGVYVLARTFGYALSGSETILAFTVGWIIGLLFDYAKIAVKQ